jgi:hypothetical protein
MRETCFNSKDCLFKRLPLHLRVSPDPKSRKPFPAHEVFDKQEQN